MKIKKLIRKLQKLEQKHGNVKVVLPQTNGTREWTACIQYVTATKGESKVEIY